MTSSPQHPGRIVKYWTESEVEKLLEEVRDGTPLKQIAQAHGRTESSVTEKLKKTAIKYIEDGKTTDEIIKLTSLTKKQIDDTKMKYVANLQAKALYQQNKIAALQKSA